MNTKANLTLGGVAYQFEIEGQDEKEVLSKIITVTNPRRVCNLCQGDRTGMYFTTNKDKEGNIYVSVKCKCGAKSGLGTYKTGGFFWKDFEQYVPNKAVEK